MKDNSGTEAQSVFLKKKKKTQPQLNLYTPSLTSSDSWSTLQRDHSPQPEICWLNDAKLGYDPLKNERLFLS